MDNVQLVEIDSDEGEWIEGHTALPPATRSDSDPQDACSSADEIEVIAVDKIENDDTTVTCEDTNDLNDNCKNLIIPSSSTNVNTFEDTTSLSKESCNWFDCLPAEIMQCIFGMLTTNDLCKVSCVSKKWNAFAMDPIFWQKIAFSHSCDILQILQVLSRMPLMKDITLKSFDGITGNELKQIVEICPQIISFDLGFMPEIGRDVILAISEHLPKIENLNVEGSKYIDTTCVTAMLNLKSLTSLNISHCTSLYDFHVQHIVVNLPLLESLNLDGISCVSSATVRKIWQHCGSWLRHLHLDGAEVTDPGIEDVAKCSQLETFSISFGERLTDEALKSIATLKHLTELRLRKCTNFTAESLKKYFNETKVFKQLIKLDLSECLQMEDTALKAITEQCENLEELGLCWCWHVEDSGVEAIVDNCHMLKVLDLTGMDRIKGDCMAKIPEKMPKLRYLDLRQCNQIHDELIGEVAKTMPKLVAYNYYGEKFEEGMISAGS